MTKRFRVAVIDDHPMVRKGVADTFAEEKDFEVVGVGGSAEEAISIARSKSPDVFVLDITMPGGGVEAIPFILHCLPDARILLLSIRDDLSTVRAGLAAGAQGYITKGVDGRELVTAARKLMGGGRYVSPELGFRLITSKSPSDEDEAEPGILPLPALTAREREILDYLSEGLSNREIGERAGLSENTIRGYLTSLLSKLGVRNRTEAALLASGIRKQA